MTSTAAGPGHPTLTELLWGLFPHAGDGSSEEFGLDTGGSQPLLHHLPQGDACCTTEPGEPVSCACLSPGQHKPKPTGFSKSRP